MKNVKKIAIGALFVLPMLFLGAGQASAREVGTNENDLIRRVHEANAGWDWEPRCAGGAEWDWDDMRCEGGTGDHHRNNHGNHHRHHNHED
ncbi:MAG TPA: hypothetical protein VK255_03665 [Patescibacteria group bacterium]|nr:hypothetical protein [Patescibacteria group bacterium]